MNRLHERLADRHLGAQAGEYTEDGDEPVMVIGRRTRTGSRVVREGNITFRILEATLVRAGLAVGLAVLAAGCQRMYWYQEGKTFDECKADREDCQAELLKRTDRRYPSSYKHRFLANCMQERGYELVAGKDLPLDVEREDPVVPSEVPWVHAYGVAGPLNPRPPSLPPDGAPAESAALTRREPKEVRREALKTLP